VIAELAAAGRRRGLAQLAGPRGMVALGLLGGAPLSVRQAALDALAPHLTGVCLAPGDAAVAAADGRLPGRTGLAADLTEPPREPLAVRLDTAFSPGAIRRIGASAALLRVPIRPDIPAQAERALRIAALATLACHEEGLPLVLRVVIPRAPGEPTGMARAGLAAEAARLAHEAGADLLVLPLAAAEGAQGTWVCELAQERPGDLSAELSMAAELGACGFALGRPLYEDGDRAWLLDAAVPLAAGLRALAEERATPLAA
jgi:tagatose-1,6-bisphosphate aldolase